MSSTTTITGWSTVAVSTSRRNANAMSRSRPSPLVAVLSSPMASASRFAVSGSGLDASSLASASAPRHLRTDAREVAHDFGNRPIGDALAVGQAAAAQDRPTVGPQFRAELADEPALSDSRQTDDREQDRFAIAARPSGGVAQECHLFSAPGQWRLVAFDPASVARFGQCAECSPGRDSFGFAVDLPRPCRLVGDGAARDGVDRGPHDDLTRLERAAPGARPR